MALAMRKGWAVLGSWCPGCIVRGVWYLVGTVCASHSCSYTTPRFLVDVGVYTKTPMLLLSQRHLSYMITSFVAVA
jgi:hypothetical protein